MDLITLVVVIAVIGMLVYFVSTLPMAEPFKLAIYIVSVLGLIWFLIGQFGHSIPNVMH